MKKNNYISATTKLFVSVVLIMATTTPSYGADKKADTKADAAQVQTRFVCSANIFYTWQPAPPAQVSEDEAAAKTKKPTPTPEPQKPIDEYIETINQSATTEQAAKDSLSRLLQPAQARASELCKNKHQAQANCVATKIKSITREYQIVDFEGRRVFMESVSDDCRLISGTCIGTKASETTCRQEATAAQAPAPEKAPEKKK